MEERIITIPGDMPFPEMLRMLQAVGVPNGIARSAAIRLKEAYRSLAPRAYICSPLHAEDVAGIRRNMLAARAYARAAEINCGIVGVAPHAYLPEFMNDNDPDQRRMALRIGLDALERCQAIYVCGNRITSGMSGELLRACALKIPAVVFHAALLPEVQKHYENHKKLVSLGTTGELALPPEMVWRSGEPEYSAAV